MESSPGGSRTVTTVGYGALCGISLLVGESLVDLLSDARLKAAFYFLGLPVYAAAGFGLAVIILVLSALIERRLLTFRREKTGVRAGVVCIPLTLVLLQGGILLNEVVLYGSPSSTLISVAVDALWCMLIVALLLMMRRAGRGLPAGLYRLDLLIGLVLCSFSVSSMCLVLDKPLEIRLRVAVAQTFMMFIIASISLLTPVLAAHAARLANLRLKRAGFIASTIAGLFVGAVLVLSFLMAPKDRFDERAPSQHASTSGANVILIVIDTLRADHLSCYGYARSTSPNLDAFSRTAVLYERCYSPSNWTPPGHASIFTGRFPISHGAHKARLGQGPRYPTCFPLGGDETTLAEVLSEHGYRTAAIVANHAFVTTFYGLDQGFRFWFAAPPRRITPTLVAIASKLDNDVQKILVKDAVPCRRATDISSLALRWIREHGRQPFFLFINFMDTHRPYRPPEPYDRAFDARLADFEPNIDDLRSGRTSFSEQQFAHIQAEYDGAIAYVDSELGSFLESLEGDGVLSSSIVVVTSDHGEFLGEKGLLEHQIGLYDPAIRVPLIIKPAEGMSLPDSSNRTTQTIDIMPTILDLLDIAIPSSVQGTSLWSEDDHPIVAQHYADEHVENWFGGRFSVDQLALISERKKYILTGSESEEMYDLESDPLEQADLATRDPESLNYFRQELKLWRQSVEVKINAGGVAPAFDHDQIRQLESLGYVSRESP